MTRIIIFTRRSARGIPRRQIKSKLLPSQIETITIEEFPERKKQPKSTLEVPWETEIREYMQIEE